MSSNVYVCGCGCRRESLIDLVAFGKVCFTHERSFMPEAVYLANLLRGV